MPGLDYVKVVGRFGLVVGDTLIDPNHDPDTLWCDSGEVWFTPLNTYTKVAGAFPVPATLGHSVIKAEIDADGYLSYLTIRSVNLVDLTSESVNPQIPEGRATHRVEFKNVRAGDTPVAFATFNARLAPDMAEEGVLDLTLVSPIPGGGGVPIVRGENGVSVESMTITGGGDLEYELDNGFVGNAGALPVGPGGSNSGVAGYIESEGPTRDALNAAIGDQVTAHEAAPNPHSQYLLTENAWGLEEVTIVDGTEVTNLESMNRWTVIAEVELVLPDAPKGASAVVHIDRLDLITWPIGTEVVGKESHGEAWVTLLREDGRWTAVIANGVSEGLPVNDASNPHPFFIPNTAHWTADNFTDFFGVAAIQNAGTIWAYIELNTSGVARLMGVMTNGRPTSTPNGGWHTRGRYDDLVRMRNAGLDLIGLVISGSDAIWDWADLAARVPENSGFNITAKTEPYRYAADPSASMVESTPVRVGYPTAVNTPADLAPWAPLGDWEYFIPSNYPPIGVGIYVASLGRMAYKTAPGVFKDSAGTQVYPVVADVSPLDRVRYGTGSPEGVVTAPIGTTFRNTEAGGWNGARVWRKDSGTGNTGWVVESGDTGLRDLPTAADVLATNVRLRRIGSTVQILASAVKSIDETTDGRVIAEIPEGFRPVAPHYIRTYYDQNGFVSGTSLHLNTLLSSTTGGDFISMTYLTAQPWPTTLPGTAV